MGLFAGACYTGCGVGWLDGCGWKERGGAGIADRAGQCGGVRPSRCAPGQTGRGWGSGSTAALAGRCALRTVLVRGGKMGPRVVATRGWCSWAFGVGGQRAAHDFLSSIASWDKFLQYPLVSGRCRSAFKCSSASTSHVLSKLIGVPNPLGPPFPSIYAAMTPQQQALCNRILLYFTIFFLMRRLFLESSMRGRQRSVLWCWYSPSTDPPLSCFSPASRVPR